MNAPAKPPVRIDMGKGIFHAGKDRDTYCFAVKVCITLDQAIALRKHADADGVSPSQSLRQCFVRAVR